MFSHSDTPDTKNRIYAYDFIRAVCCIGIVMYHYSCHLETTSYYPLYMFVNGYWGTILVTVFFLLSGSVLYYNHSTVPSVIDFYRKRWKSIYPMFYIAFIAVYIKRVISHGSFFYKGRPLTLILSLLGLDGYFLYTCDNYYILGEWFLGAIIILYVLYPLLLKVFQKSSLLTTLAILAAYIYLFYDNSLKITDARNIINCLMWFECGMLLAKYRTLLSDIRTAGASVLIFAAIYFIKMPVNYVILCNIAGLALFIMLYKLGSIVMKNGTLNSAFSFISRISYAIFLTHHVFIQTVLDVFEPVSFVDVYALLILLMICIVIISYGLYWCNRRICKKIER